VGAFLALLAMLNIANAQQEQTVKMALSNSVMTVIYPYVTNAQAFGFFKQEGIKDEVVMGQGSSQVLSLLVAGTVDLVFCNPEPVMQLIIERSSKIKSIYKTNLGQYILAVPEGSPIQSVKDLKGKRLGMFGPQSGIDYLKARLFDDGLTTNDITIVPTAFGGQTIVAVRQGQVDALLYWPDAILMLRNAGLNLRELPKADWEQGLYISVVAASEDAIAKKPDAIARALRAMAQGQMVSAGNPGKTVEAFWKQYPDQAPRPNDREKAFRENLARVNWQNKLNGTEGLTGDALRNYRWGAQSAEVWGRLQDNLFRVGSLPRKIDPQAFFDARFEDQANAFDRAKVMAISDAPN
jgi:NitT/TauT family transport system substrate-binding protein